VLTVRKVIVAVTLAEVLPPTPSTRTVSPSVRPWADEVMTMGVALEAPVTVRTVPFLAS
jgi:hypothetical protein